MSEVRKSFAKIVDLPRGLAVALQRGGEFLTGGVKVLPELSIP